MPEPAWGARMRRPLNWDRHLITRQMKVLVDERMPEPTAPGYLSSLSRRIDELVQRTDGGAFVLCTNWHPAGVCGAVAAGFW